MKFRLVSITFILLIGLSACDTSLQKATQQLLSKEKTSTPAPQDADTEGQTLAKEDCPQPDPHPMGESIAKKFNTAYEEVIDWHCQGYIFEDILLALQTSQLTGVEPEVLLEDVKTKSWEAIWEELDLLATQ